MIFRLILSTVLLVCFVGTSNAVGPRNIISGDIIPRGIIPGDILPGDLIPGHFIHESQDTSNQYSVCDVCGKVYLTDQNSRERLGIIVFYADWNLESKVLRANLLSKEVQAFLGKRQYNVYLVNTDTHINRSNLMKSYGVLNVPYIAVVKHNQSRWPLNYILRDKKAEVIRDHSGSLTIEGLCKFLTKPNEEN